MNNNKGEMGGDDKNLTVKFNLLHPSRDIVEGQKTIKNEYVLVYLIFIL